MILSFFLTELLPPRTLKVARDLDFLEIIGDSIFLRTKFEIFSEASLLNSFYYALTIGCFKTFKSKTFLLLMLFLYYYDKSSNLFII